MKLKEITSPQILSDTAEQLGFLPFFKNSIPGFSIEELCPERLWFTDEQGPWEWKGPVIRAGACAYGKFFRGKAVYVSLRWLPHLCNYRRDGYDFDARCDDGLVFYREKEIYDAVASSGELTSKQLRAKLKDSKDTDKYLTKLQMQTYLVTADFVYEQDRHGKPYGWGVAKYAAPEYLYGDNAVRSMYGISPENSYQAIYDRIKEIFPHADGKVIAKLIK